MSALQCENCLAPLKIYGDKNWLFLLNNFPQDLFSCYWLITQGPGALICLRCKHVNVLGSPHVLVANNKKSYILYLPEDTPERDRVLKVVNRLRRAVVRSTLIVTKDRQEFRRAVITTILSPSLALLNKFMLAQDKLTWLSEKKSEVNASLFAGLWLLVNGVAPTFSATASTIELNPEAFIPHEQAPDAASNVRAQRQTESLITDHVGELLYTLLTKWALTIVSDHSLRAVKRVIPSLFVLPSPGEAVINATAARVGGLIEQYEKSDQTLMAYLLEALFTIVCHYCKVNNPRRDEWTGRQLMYDIIRRRNVEDEKLLLEPAFIRETIDESQFWRDYEYIGKSLGLSEISNETKQQILHMLDAAERVFPGSKNDPGLEFRPPKDWSDEHVLAQTRSLLVSAIDDLPVLTRIRAVFVGLRRHRRELMLPAQTELTNGLAANSGVPEVVVASVLRLLIEQLNLANYHKRACEIGGQLGLLLDGGASEKIEPNELGPLYNEIGNCYRYERDFNKALLYYDKALDAVGKDPKKKYPRIGLRNRAIVLRELHRYGEARRIFEALRPLARDEELRGLVISEALCLVEMGHDNEALALLQEHRRLVEGRSVKDLHVLAFASLLASLLLNSSRLEDASELKEAIEREATRTEDFLARTVAGQIGLALGRRDNDQVQIRAAIACLGDIAKDLRRVKNITISILRAMEDLDNALVADGRIQHAEELIRGIVSDLTPVDSPKAWVLYLLAARHAARRNDHRQAISDLRQALEYLDRAVWAVTTTDDVMALLSPQATNLDDLVRLALQYQTSQPTKAGILGRLAADIRAAPVVTSRVRRSADLPFPTQSIEAEAERLDNLLKQTRSGIVQFVSVGDDVVALRTITRTAWLGLAPRRVEQTAVRVGLTAETVKKIARRLDFELRNANPLSHELKLDAVRGCEDLYDKLRLCFRDLPADLPLYIAAGPVGEVAVSLALPAQRSICFIPSIAALIALRARRNALSNGFKPKSLFDFAVWFDKERSEEAFALGEVVVSGAALAKLHGLAYDSASGTKATRERLLNGLASSDAARIACHGRVLPDAEAVDLLVAAEGYLPPSNLNELWAGDAEPHIVGWHRLAELPRAPAVVCSSACDSGLTIVNEGGERLGLERPLFTAGTIVFVAPLWPVPIVSTQKMISELLNNWLESPSTPVAQHAAAIRGSARQSGVPPLAARALSVFGDGH